MGSKVTLITIYDKLCYTGIASDLLYSHFNPCCSDVPEFCSNYSVSSSQRTISRRTPMMGGRSSSPSQAASLNIWADTLLHPSSTGCNQLQENGGGESPWCRKLYPGKYLEIFSEALCAWWTSYVPAYQPGRRFGLCSAETTLTYFWITMSVKQTPLLSIITCCLADMGHLSWTQGLISNTEFFRYYFPSFWLQQEPITICLAE